MIRRSVSFSTTALQQMFGGARGLLPQGFVRASDIIHASLLPRLKRGEEWGDSIVTDGTSVSLLFRKARVLEAEGQGGAEDLDLAANGGVPGWVATEHLKGIDAGATYIAVCTSRSYHPLTGEKVEYTQWLSRDEWRARCKDEERLREARHRCARAGLDAPGGAWSRLAAVTRKTASVGRFEDYLRAAADAHPDMFKEKLKGWWARNRYDRYLCNRAGLVGFYSRLLAGSLEHGDGGVRPVLVIGDMGVGRGVSTGKGRKSTPSTAAEAACAIACGARLSSQGNPCYRKGSEYRSTALHGKAAEGGAPACWARLEPVIAPTPERIYRQQAERAQAALPAQWAQRPTPPLPHPWRKVRGKQWCPECCVFVHRDKHPCGAIVLDQRSLARGEGGEVQMRRSTVVPKVQFAMGGFHQFPVVPRAPPFGGEEQGGSAQ